MATKTSGRQRRQRQRGQSMVEFAIASGVLLLIAMGLLDLGRVYYFHVSMNGAVREGARHGVWFNPGTESNPYLDDQDIRKAVNESLTGSAGLTATIPGGVSTCPAPTDGNSFSNPPFGGASYPAALNSPYLYICVRQQNGSWTSPGGLGWTTPANAGGGANDYRQGDLVVILLMSYGLVSGFLQPVIGQGIQTVAFAHFYVQGSTPS